MKRPKLHKCPECKRQHTGFTEICGDCIADTLRGAVATAVEGRPVTIVTSRPITNNQVPEPLNNQDGKHLHGGKRIGAGRPKKEEVGR